LPIIAISRLAAESPVSRETGLQIFPWIKGGYPVHKKSARTENGPALALPPQAGVLLQLFLPAGLSASREGTRLSPSTPLASRRGFPSAEDRGNGGFGPAKALLPRWVGR